MIRLLPLLLILAVIACALPSRADTAPLALTFGRCDLPSACPRPADSHAAGDATFQSELLKCFGTSLGRPVTALGAADIPAGYWLDASYSATKVDAAQGDRIFVTFVLRRGAGEFLDGFKFMLPGTTEAYREICRQFSERIRPKLQ